MSTTLFVSDLHLAPARPAAVAAFRAFCRGPARAAGAVYILGDLYDVWLGDDQLRDPFAADVAAAIEGVTKAGVPVHVALGNHDFLLGERFLRSAGAVPLRGPEVIDLHGTPTLVLHGDELCVDDVAYQRYREWTRNPRRQRRWLALPWFMRRALVAGLRLKSRGATSGKAPAIMDVSADAVDAAFRNHGVTRIIHGHTHRPARHTTTIDGRSRERFVLADWYRSGSYLEFDADGGRVRDIAAENDAGR